MTRAIIFDCFGVLLGKGFEHTYELAGGDPTKDRPFIEDMLGQANLGLISEADFHAGVAEQIGVEHKVWHEAIEEAEQPDAQLLDYIATLHETYKTAVLSNANRGVLQERLGPQILERCFDEIVVSAEVGMLKPNTEIYFHTAELLGVNVDECIFIDDREFFLQPARELGMKTVLYQNYAQATGEIDRLLANPEN